MSLDIDVLRALLRLARRRTSPTLDQLVERVGADEPAVRRALVGLARSGLVQRTPAGIRLSLAGLAVAVAFAKHPYPKARPAAPATLPLVRSSRQRSRRAA
jgi:DNA-binding IclR family transcriptional regulator